MLNKFFSTTTLSAVLLISGLDSAAASEPVNATSLSQPVAVYTAEQRALYTKGLHYRPGPSSKNRSRAYRINDSKKSHKPVISKKSYYSDGFSRPNPSHKLNHRARVV